MFSKVFSDFQDRKMEVDQFFSLMGAMENEQIEVVTGIGSQYVNPGRPPTEWNSLIKGASYLLLYNLVEAFVRRGFQAVFDEIKCNGLCGADLSTHFRTQWISQKNRKVTAFDGSPKVYMEIAHNIVDEIIGNLTVELSHDQLPVSGNLDGDSIREVFKDHGLKLKSRKVSRGGASLNLIKCKRNGLSHGNESFMECGRSSTVSDLIKAKNEVFEFLKDVLDSLEKVASEAKYKR